VDHIPILRMGEFLLITVQVDMHDRLALQLQDDLTSNSFIGRMLDNVAAMSRILGADTVVVGMQPAVAITLVELGLSLPGIRTALDVEKGMRILRSQIDSHDFRNGEEEATVHGSSRTD
jgi:rsbT antagonist protein RsbS